MTNTLNKLAGVVILAGGASSRMGTPKAMLTLPTGERLLDYHVRHALSSVVADTNVANTNLPIMIADNGRGFDVHLDLASHKAQSPILHITDYSPLQSTISIINTASIKGTASINGDAKIENGGALVAIESALQTLINLNYSSTVNTPSTARNRQSSWLLVISCDSLIPATDLWQTLQPLLNQAHDKDAICLSDEHHLYPLLGLYRLSVEPDLKAYIDSGQRRVMSFIQPMTHCVPFIKAWQHLTNFNTPEDFKRACTALSQL